MEGKIVKKLHHHIKQQNEQYVQSISKHDNLTTTARRTVEMHERRGATIVRSLAKGDIIRSSKVDNQIFIEYCQQNERLIRMKDDIYLEEKIEHRRAMFVNGKLVEDRVITPIPYQFIYREQKNVEIANVRQSFTYNRREAVRYAERWWNDYNPNFQQFEVNCTNFVSQCLRAGGAPMAGFSTREKGWWYQGNNWSFSWSVAHSLRWYLSGASSGLRGEERQSASELLPGDIICYDFDGNGRWQHSTIVVAYDANKEPLVNAQTANSRMRYWKYEDSTAWTPNIKYKFFHIK